MSRNNFGKRLSTALISLALLGAIFAPLANFKQASASYNQHLKYSANTLRIKVNDQNIINSGVINTVLGRAGKINKIAKLFNKSSNSSVQNSLDSALSGYYTVSFSNNVDMDHLVNDLKNVPGVEAAYPQVKAAPLPNSPNFASLETYLKAAPTGINSNYATTFPGAMGSKVKIVDIEYSWNTAHEDLTKAAAALVPHGTPVDPFSDNNHGTAVLGEMEANNNSLGAKGAVYNAKLALINAYSSEYGYDLVGALSSAASITQPGDIVQIEQQTWGPTPDTYDFVPVEWIPEVYDAIKSLTDSGRVVVEPAGNGGQNLDDSTYYGTSFPMGKPDSGAIIVGAGENCSGSSPYLSRMTFSDYGKRVNLQGPGDCVVTAGYGDLYYADGNNAYYTQNFSGTSSATPIVSSAAASLSSAYKYLNNDAVLSPLQILSILIAGSTPQNTSTGTLTGNIGPYPDLAKALLKADISAPSVPTGLQAVLTTNKKPSISISWSPSSDNVKIASYRLYRNGLLYKTLTGTSFTDVNVTKGKTYTYSISAVDASANVSGISSSVSITVR